jgi:hypothetical protein
VDAITGRLTCPWGEESREALVKRDEEERIDATETD